MPAFLPRRSWTGPAKYTVSCACTDNCAVLLLTEYDDWGTGPEQWCLDVCQRVRCTDWHGRVRVAWAVLRGRDPWTHSMVLAPHEARGLRDFLIAKTRGHA